MRFIVKSVGFIFISLFSAATVLADCGPGTLFALNPSQTFAAMKTFEKAPRILVWNVSTGKATELAYPDMYVQELYFTDDNHLLAVGSYKSYGPIYEKWDLSTGARVSFTNRTFRDFSDARTNFSRNMKYAVTSSQLAFGGWGYMVIDLETGKDIYTKVLSRGQGQVSDDAKVFYYMKDRREGSSPYSELWLNALDMTSNRNIFSGFLGGRDSHHNRLGWAGDLLVLYNDNAIAFNMKTKRLENPQYLGPLLDWSSDFSVRVSDDLSRDSSFKVVGVDPQRAISFLSSGAKSIVKLSPDAKKVALVSYDAEVTFFDLATRTMTTVPTCHEVAEAKTP